MKNYLLASTMDATGVLRASIESGSELDTDLYNRLIRQYRKENRQGHDNLVTSRLVSVNRQCEHIGRARRMRGGRYVDHEPTEAAEEYIGNAMMSIDFWNYESQIAGNGKVMERTAKLMRRAWEALRDATKNDCGDRATYTWEVREACRLGHIVTFKAIRNGYDLYTDYDVVFATGSKAVTLVRKYITDTEEVFMETLYSRTAAI